MLHHLKNAVVIAGAALCIAALPAPVRAQGGDEVRARVTPGWVFTPTVAIGAIYDDNPVLAGHGDPTPDDIYTNVRPGGDLTFTAKHLFFGSGYRGSIQRYRTLDQYDNYAQGGYVEFRQQPSRRMSLFVRDNVSVTPSTDLVNVAGVPFSRTGTRSNDFNAGLTTSVTKKLQLSGTYHFQWVEFDRHFVPLSLLLQGGHSNSVTLGARRSLSSRVKVGGDYTMQRGTMGQLIERPAFTIQNAEGIVSYQVSPTVLVEGGAGISHVVLPEPAGSRTGPAGHIALRKRTEYASLSISAMRSFVPAFGFGGSIRNQEVVGSVRLPFARNRAFVDGGLVWRNSEPVLVRELGLKAFLVQTTVGYAFHRWLSLEGFYNGAFQDSTSIGGRVDRNRFGVHVVTSRPMRLR